MKRSYIKRKKSNHDWPAMVEETAKRANNHCERCGMHIPNPSPANVSHRLPRSKGGSDDLNNLDFLCASMDYYGGEDLSCHGFVHSNPIAAKEGNWLK